MRIYTVYEPNDILSNIVAIKEGFNWIAFLFSVLWALFNRLWLWSLGIVIANVFMGWFLIELGGDFVVQTVTFFGLALIIGWTGNDFKRQNLAKRGFREAAILLADSKETAVSRYVATAPDRLIKTPRNRAGGPW